MPACMSRGTITTCELFPCQGSDDIFAILPKYCHSVVKTVSGKWEGLHFIKRMTFIQPQKLAMYLLSLSLSPLLTNGRENSWQGTLCRCEPLLTMTSDILCFPESQPGCDVDLADFNFSLAFSLSPLLTLSLPLSLPLSISYVYDHGLYINNKLVRLCPCFISATLLNM